MLKNQLLDLYVGIAMKVKKPTPIYKTYVQVLQRMLKKSNKYLQYLYANILMDVKKLTTIYKIYMWVLHI
jgi:hypothetical protein